MKKMMKCLLALIAILILSSEFASAQQSQMKLNYDPIKRLVAQNFSEDDFAFMVLDYCSCILYPQFSPWAADDPAEMDARLVRAIVKALVQDNRAVIDDDLWKNRSITDPEIAKFLRNYGERLKCDAREVCDYPGSKAACRNLKRPREMLTIFKYLIATGKSDVAIRIYQRGCSASVPEENRLRHPSSPNAFDEGESLIDFMDKLIELNPDADPYRNTRRRLMWLECGKE